MKEVTFDVSDFTVDVNRGDGCKCDLSKCAVSSSQELTDHNETVKVTIAKRGPNKGKEVRRPIPSRYQRRYYGAEVSVEVTCGCGKTSATEIWKDECPASGMDELV